MNQKLLTIPLTLVILSMLVGTAFGEITIKNNSIVDTEKTYGVGKQVYFANHESFDVYINILGVDHIATSGNSYAFSTNMCGLIPFTITGIGEGVLNIVCSEQSQIYVPNTNSTIVEPQNTTVIETPSNSTVIEPQVPVESQNVQTPNIEFSTNTIAGTHNLGIVTSNYQGTKKLVTFSGDGFRTSETLDVVIYNQNNTMVASAQTTVAGNGGFSVPSMVETSGLENSNYNMILSGTDTNIEITVTWDGTQFSFVKIQSMAVEPPIVSGNWTEFLYGLDTNDRVGLIRAVLQYLLS